MCSLLHKNIEFYVCIFIVCETVAGFIECSLDPIYTRLATAVQVLYLLEICWRDWVLYDEV